MNWSKNILAVIFLLIPVIGFGQMDLDTAKTLRGLINSEGIFFNCYNKRDQAFKKRLKEIVVREKIDTIVIFINEYMDVQDKKYDLQRDDREYLIYQKKGRTYVDYFTYVKGWEYNKFRSSKRNLLKKGKDIFAYYINSRIDTITGNYQYKSDSSYKETDNMSGYSGYVNLGSEFYEIRGIQDYEVNQIIIDDRILFYRFIMKCLRNEGL